LRYQKNRLVEVALHVKDIK